MQGGDKKTVIGRICFHCETPVSEEARFCDSCGGDLDLAKWMAQNADPTLPPADAKPAPSQIPAEQLLKARPELTIAPTEQVCFSQDLSLAVLISAQGCFSIHLKEMRAEVLLAEPSSGRRGACSPDGSRFLLVDLASTILYFFDLKPGAPPEIRAFQYPELSGLQGELSVAVAAQAAVSTSGGSLFLFDWASGAMMENIPLHPEETPRRLSFAPDGSLLCGLSTQTFLFDTAGGSHELPGVKVALNAQGTKMAALLPQESGPTILQIGDVQSLAPFSWKPTTIKKPNAARITDLCFSSDGSSLLALINADGASVEVLSVTDGAVQSTLQEPLYPGVGFAKVAGFAASAERAFAFSTGFVSYDSFEQTSALFCYSLQPTFKYNGAVSLALRAANTPFAAPEGDLDAVLPIGETTTGYFGRLDQILALGADWSCPQEYPELVARVLLGEDERALFEGTALAARDDYEERLRFWFSLGAMTGVRSLVDASIGLTPLLAAIVKLAGGETSSNDQLLTTCFAVSKYTPDQRARLLQDNAGDSLGSADTIPPADRPATPPPMLPLPVKIQELQVAPKPAPRPAPRAAPTPPGGTAKKAQPTMIANAADVASMIAALPQDNAVETLPEEAKPLQAAPKPAPRPAPMPPGGAAKKPAQPTMIANAADVASMIAALPQDNAVETMPEEKPQAAPKPAPKPAPRPAPAPPGGGAPKRTAQATMVASADEVAAAMAAAPDPAAKVPVVVASANPSNVGSPAPFSGKAPAPFSASPAPFSQAAPQPPDPKAEQKSAFKKSLDGLQISEDAAIALLALPLCEVAWADGDSASKESAMVADYIAKQITLKSPTAASLANQWLKACPKPDYCDQARALLRDMVKADYHPAMTKDAIKEILRISYEIAGAAGGFLGMGKVSKEEKQVLSKLEASLKLD